MNYVDKEAILLAAFVTEQGAAALGHAHYAVYDMELQMERLNELPR